MLFRRTDCVVSTDPDRFRHVRDKIRHANRYAWGLSGLTREHDLIPRTQYPASAAGRNGRVR